MAYTGTITLTLSGTQLEGITAKNNGQYADSALFLQNHFARLFDAWYSDAMGAENARIALAVRNGLVGTTVAEALAAVPPLS